MPRYRIQARDRASSSRWTIPALAAGGAALAIAAAANQLATWRAERRQPPIGGFLNADGVRLHYIDKGDGPAVVLIHGAGAMIQDFSLSILHRLTRHHRVIVFDRPGYGYSERPRDRRWTPEAQARAIRAGVRQLGLERPLIVGHSYGASVALSYAMHFPAEIRGIVLVSGYYFPTFRPAISAFGALATPVVGDLLRYTLAPVISRAATPEVLARLFAPNPVPPLFVENFPFDLACRPSQIRAAADDVAGLRPWARRMRHIYPAIKPEPVILTGMVDQIVDPNGHSTRLHRAIPGSVLRVIPGVGHMLHHVRPDLVLQAVAGFDPAKIEAAEAPAMMP